MGSRMSKLNEANGFLSCPHKTRTARAPQILLVSQKTAQKEGAVRVWYAILLICAPEFFHSMGVMSTKNCELDFCQLVIAHERSATVGHAKQHAQSMDQYFSNSVTNNKQQASKIWPLARGFLPYKRESKDYKSY